MDWKNFKPQSDEDLALPRAIAMIVEGEDPLAPIEPIADRGAPKRCTISNERLRFDHGGATCPGECTHSQVG